MILKSFTLKETTKGPFQMEAIIGWINPEAQLFQTTTPIDR